MKQQLWPSNDRSPGQRLNRAFGEINVFLLAIAIGLAVLDFTGFVALRTSAELTRAHASATAETPSPSFFEPYPFR